jgi:membrane-anchored protein YejM (alkaline phosphatase superfamily)
LLCQGLFVRNIKFDLTLFAEAPLTFFNSSNESTRFTSFVQKDCCRIVLMVILAIFHIIQVFAHLIPSSIVVGDANLSPFVLGLPSGAT